jgi:hypothetical protein
MLWPSYHYKNLGYDISGDLSCMEEVLTKVASRNMVAIPIHDLQDAMTFVQEAKLVQHFLDEEYVAVAKRLARSTVIDDEPPGR